MDRESAWNDACGGLNIEHRTLNIESIRLQQALSMFDVERSMLNVQPRAAASATAT
jgi:hypothetical protein